MKNLADFSANLQSFSKRDFSIFQREFFALSSGLGVGPKFMFYWWIFGVVLDAVLAACLKKMEGGIENNVRRARTTESYAICLLTYVRSNKEILSTLENYSRLYNRHATLHTNVSKHTHTYSIHSRVISNATWAVKFRVDNSQATPQMDTCVTIPTQNSFIFQQQSK